MSGRSRHCGAGSSRLARPDVGTLKQYVDMLPEYLTRRFISAEQDAVIVSGRIPDADASQLLPVVERSTNRCTQVRAQHPGYSISVTGLSAIAARNSANMIDKLNRGLTIEFVFVAAFIGAGLPLLRRDGREHSAGDFSRSSRRAPCSGAMGEGLQFASIVALTVSFGLGLSATIHFLNRLRLEDKPDEDPGIARRTRDGPRRPGPDPDLGRARLRAGRDGLLRPCRRCVCFGWLSAFAMLAALTADLLILRPTAMFLQRFSRRATAWRERRRSPRS